MKIIQGIIGVAFLFFFFSGCGENTGRERIGTISEFIGKVEAFTPGSGAWSEVRQGMAVRSGDSLRSGSESQAMVSFDGNTITLGENTTTAFTDTTGADGQRILRIFEQCGEVLSDIKHLSRNGRGYEVATPTAVTSIRGTHFAVLFSPVAWATDVRVLEGRVLVANPFVDAPPVVLLPGFFTTVALHAVPFAPAPMNYGQFKKLERMLGGKNFGRYEKKFKVRRGETNYLLPLVPFGRLSSPSHAIAKHPGKILPGLPGKLHKAAPGMLPSGPNRALPGLSPGSGTNGGKKDNKKSGDKGAKGRSNK